MNKLPAWAFALLSVVAFSDFAFAAPKLSREDFNRLAAQEGLPLYWSAAGTDPKMPEPGEILGVGAGVDLSRYVSGGRLTEEFQRAYAGMVEARRLEAVRRELDQGRPHLLVGDFRGADDPVGPQIAVGALRAADADRLVGQLDVQRLHVGF